MEIPFKKLGDVCQNLDSKRVPITKNKRIKGEIPYYGASGIVDYVQGHLFDEELLLVSEDGANLLARTYPIAFSVKGKTWVNNHAHVLKFENIIGQRFIEYYLNSIKLDDYISGMAQPKLNQKSLNSIIVPSPPLAEQKQIVALLDQAFAAIDQAKANIEKNIENAKALFQSKLNEIFSRTGDGWEERSLGEVVNISSGGTPSKKDSSFWDGHIPWVSPKDMKSLNIYDSRDKITSKALEGGKAKLLNIDTVLIVVRSGILSHTIPLGITKKEVTINQDLKALKTSSKLLPQYFLNFLRSSEPLLLSMVTRGATVHRIETPTLKQLRISFPNKEEQSEINTLVEKLEEQIKDLLSFYEQGIKNLQELKKSLLQKAFAGELTSIDSVNVQTAVES